MIKIISRLFGRSGPVYQAPLPPIGEPRGSLAGVVVNEETALNFSPWFACTKILAEDVGKLPLQVFEEAESGGRKKRSDHPVSSLVKDEPNPFQTAFNFRETLQAHICAWGNCYAEIERNKRGQPIALWPLSPAQTTPKILDSGSLVYEFRDRDRTTQIPAADIIHVAGLGFDGLKGYSVVSMARRALGLGIAMQEFGERWFGQGHQNGILLRHPGVMTAEGRKNLKEYIEEEGSGLQNAHRIRVVQEGISVENLGIPPEDAQFLQSRKFQIAEAARYFRMPLHKLGELDRATFSNIEQQSLEYLVDCLMPWLVRWEQEFTRKLFTKKERAQGLYCRFNFDALLRGDSAARAKFLQTACGGPWMSVNEVRSLEEREAVEGGDSIRAPMNLEKIS